MHDAIVVGGGPAGLAAATWLGRHRRATLLVDSGQYRNGWVDRSHGYLGRDHVDPAELRAAARDDLGHYPLVELRAGEVTAARAEGGRFVLTVDGDEVAGRRVVLATGVADAFPDVAGFFEHYGASVFHCPTCDGYEARGRHVVALGWGEQVAGFALTLLDWVAAVTIVTDGHRFEGDDEVRSSLEAQGVHLVEAAATRFEGERGRLAGVELSNGERLPCDLAFFSVAHQPRHELATQLGARLTGDGCVEVDDECRTSVEGVYACGDLTPGIQLVQVAAAKGTIAGISCAMSLRGEPPVHAAVPEPGPDPDAALPS